MEYQNTTSLKLWRTAFASEHYVGLFSGQQTHDPALRFIGQIIRFTQDTDVITNLVQSALPSNYEGNTLEEIPAIVENAINKGYADQKPFEIIEGETQAKALISLAKNSGAVFFSR